MKIYPCSSLNINFKANYSKEKKDSIYHFAYDCSGEKIRSAIRAHMYPQLLFSPDPYDEITDTASTIEDVFIPNMEYIGAGSYKGASLFRYPAYLDLLKNSGISTVVDLAGSDGLKNICMQKNINYYRYYVPLDYWAKPIFTEDEQLFNKKRYELYEKSLTNEEFISQMQNYKTEINLERKAFVDEFIDFTDIMNRGALYIGCDLGEYRTPNILALNAYFNPKWQGLKAEPTTEFVKERIKNMYNNLTNQDKSRLGFTEAFDKNLAKKLKDGIVSPVF